MFVAAFIGNPPINIVPGRLSTAEGGRTVLRVGSQTVPLPSSVETPAADGAATGDVLVGIRPHDVQTEPVTGPGALRVDVDLDLVERLGTETIAHGELMGVAGAPPTGAAALSAASLVHADQELSADGEGTRFAAALGSHATVTPGTLLPLYVPVERLHLFDAETGLSVHPGQRRGAEQAPSSRSRAG